MEVKMNKEIRDYQESMLWGKAGMGATAPLEVGSQALHDRQSPVLCVKYGSIAYAASAGCYGFGIYSLSRLRRGLGVRGHALLPPLGRYMSR